MNTSAEHGTWVVINSFSNNERIKDWPSFSSTACPRRNLSVCCASFSTVLLSWRTPWCNMNVVPFPTPPCLRRLSLCCSMVAARAPPYLHRGIRFADIDKVGMAVCWSTDYGSCSEQVIPHLLWQPRWLERRQIEGWPWRSCSSGGTDIDRRVETYPANQCEEHVNWDSKESWIWIFVWLGRELSLQKW